MGFLNHQYSYQMEPSTVSPGTINRITWNSISNHLQMVGYQLDDDSKSLYRKWLVGNHHFQPLKSMVVWGIKKELSHLTIISTLQRTNISHLGKKDNRLFGVPGFIQIHMVPPNWSLLSWWVTCCQFPSVRAHGDQQICYVPWVMKRWWT